MFRKTVSLLLALVLLCACLPALALSGSKSTKDMTQVVGGSVNTPAVVVQPQLTATAQGVLHDITAIVAAGGTAASYFAGKATNPAGAPSFMGPTGDSTNAELQLSELVSLGAYNLEGATGSFVSTIGFATEYQAGQNVVVCLGYKGPDGSLIWTTLEVVVVGGMLQITFPVALLKEAGSDMVLAVLSN
ncbi:MAG: hypothetical protein GX418_00575 [Clostridiales bacterium]|nr:hypothetical protein [Clostridiales bacterium]